MRVVSFVAGGKASYGIAGDDGIVDLGRRLGARHATLRAALAGGALGDFRSAAAEQPDLPLAAARLLPPVPDPDKIICIGLNYRAHALEGGYKIPENMSLFSRFANTLVAQDEALVRPRLSSDFDYEGELAVVIGKAGRHIDAAQALQHVFGYSCFNDASVRDFQLKHSVTAGKNFHRTGGFGPWITTADEIPDPSRLTLRTRVNGTEVQHGRTDDLIFSVPQIIAYVSSWTPLLPGDVIATGTPEGVGFARKPPLWLKPGDTVEVEISGIGVLRNPIAAEEA